MVTWKATALAALGCLASAVCAEEGPAAAGVPANGRNAFSFPLPELSEPERTRFAIGNSFFRRNWVEAPASTKARDGLGPFFIARSCGGCHVQDGRGAPPAKPGETPVALLMRLSVPGIGAHGGPLPEPTYGDQFTTLAVQGVKAEGRLVVTQRRIHGRFADGTRYTLLQPVYRFAGLGYGAMRADVMTSPRVAPQLAGIGLIEAIPEAEIEANAREQAAAGGPVRGVPNRVWDAFANEMRVGRFGWKANVASIPHQTGGAFNGDMGITSSRFPAESCTAFQRDCLAAPHGGTAGAPEIDDKTFADVVFYQQTLAPALPRDVDDPQVREGARLFETAQCAACHRPSYRTASGDTASPALQGRTIRPYTDLLLHDMGEALADGRPDFAATGRQWRTAPLWGIGLIPDVNGHQRLLHDGRARGVLEAVLWHGGEAEASKQKVLRMNRSQREALVRFVNAL
jgi:CxxC motif-containing protein (DUF1111 family)